MVKRDLVTFHLEIYKSVYIVLCPRLPRFHMGLLPRERDNGVIGPSGGDSAEPEAQDTEVT